jgi:hypothetical protein
MLVKFLNITDNNRFLAVNGMSISVKAHEFSNPINVQYDDYSQVMINNKGSFLATIMER